MRLVTTLSVEPLEGKIRYHLVIQQSEGTDPLEEEFSCRLSEEEIIDLQKTADRLLRSTDSPNFTREAKKKGLLIYKTLIPKPLRERLKELSGPLLIRTPLYGIPWEVLYDGEEFWGLRYALGKRIVMDRAVPARTGSNPGGRPRALIIGSDPRGDLRFVENEIDSICKTLEDVVDICCVVGTGATFDSIMEYLNEEFDLIHYAGHIVQGRQGELALLLAEERQLSAAVIERNIAGHPLVFLNGCASVRGDQAPRVEQWEKMLSSVAYAFLFGGAAGVVGTLCDVSDENAAFLATEFYGRVLESVAVGEALRQARLQCRKRRPNSAIWLSMALHGAPLLVPFREKANPEVKSEQKPAQVQHLFGSNGEFLADSWRREAIEVFINARAEALARSSQTVGPYDLLVALVGTSLFRSILDPWGKQVAVTVPDLLVKLVRAQTGSVGPAPLPKSITRRSHLTGETLAIIETAGKLRGVEPIGVRHLLLAILSGTVADINELLGRVGIDRLRMEKTLNIAEQPSAVSPPDVPIPRPSALRRPSPEVGTPSPSDSVFRNQSPELFDAFGQLRNEDVGSPCFEVLNNAAREAADVGDEVIEPVHIFVALLCSPEVQKGLGIPVEDRELLSRFARSTIYLLFGKRPSQAKRAVLPERRFFSNDALEILRFAARSDFKPLRWESLLSEIGKFLAPKLDSIVIGDERGSKAPVQEFIKKLVSGRPVPPGPRFMDSKYVDSAEGSQTSKHPLFEASGKLQHQKLEKISRTLLNAASGMAHRGEVTEEHLLAAILEKNDSLLTLALALQGIDARELKGRLIISGDGSSPLIYARCSAGLRTILSAAAKRALNHQPVDERHLTQALLEFPNPVLNRIFDASHIDLSRVREAIEQSPQILLRRASMPALYQYGRDLTEEARAGRIPPLIGRHNELRQIGLVLARKDKSNVLLIGEAGVGKTAIVEGLARNIAEGSAPSHLMHRRIIEINAGQLVAGTSLRGDLEARIQALLSDTELHPEVILFIDEFHAFLHLGGHGDRTALTVGNQLKSALARGSISVIGATTTQELALSVERDPAMMRRFRLIHIVEPSPEETLEILRRIKAHLEKNYHVTVSDDALITAVTLADRHLPGHMPDKARDLVVDTCAARMVEGLSGDDTIVSAEDIARVTSDLIKIPVGTLAEAARETALSHEAALARRVVGQDEAIARVASRLRTAAILRDPRRPVAVLLFAGPTGVGKTEMARAIASEYCGGVEALTTIPMNEYGEKLTVSRLTGVGPGWVGHDEEPVLLTALKNRPHSVILLDEIEKAHADVWKILMRLFDEGILVDPRSNREVNGREAIYIMTSNLVLSETAAVGFTAAGNRHVTDPRKVLIRFFPSEFVNRIDEIVLFAQLDFEAARKIVAIRLLELTGRVRQEHKVEVQFNDSIAEWVATRAFSPEFGARELARFIDTQVREPLSAALVDTLKGVSLIQGTLVDGSLRFEKAVPTQKTA